MFTQYFDLETLEIFKQLSLAVGLGAIIGIERELARKTAGVRTHALIALGAALFSIISKYAFKEFWGLPGFDPSRIASQVVVGVGFIGTGLIFLNQSRSRGLTTAAGLWVSAAIGMAVGYRMYSIAVFSTFLTLVIFVAFWFFENLVVKRLPARVNFEERDEHV